MGKAKNIANTKIDNLTPLFRVKKNEEIKERETRWLCLCDCGNIAIINSSEFRRKYYHSCGCTRGNNNWNSKDLTGKRFSRLTVLRRNKTYQKEHNLSIGGYWDC